MPTLEGQSIGEFEILSSLGQGGMGTFYLAGQTSLNRRVAIVELSATHDHIAQQPVAVPKPRPRFLIHAVAAGAAIAIMAQQAPPVAAAIAPASQPQPAAPITAPAATPESRVSDADSAFIKSVAALPPEQQITHVMAKLKELNPQFDGKESHKIENAGVTELAFSTVGVTDIAPLKALKWLKRLSMAPAVLNQRGALSDLSPLAGLPLTGLWCQGNAISDLSPLKGMPLTVLSCGGTQIKDLAPLTGMKLTVLSINDTEVADLGPLEGMPLTILWCNNTKVTDLSPLKALPLQELKCDFVADRDTELLRGIKTLARINNAPVVAFWMRARPTSAAGQTKTATTPTPSTSSNTPGKSVDNAFVKEIAALPPEQQVARVMAKLKQLNPVFEGTSTHASEDGKITEFSITATRGLGTLSPLRALSSLRNLRYIANDLDLPLVDLRALRDLPLVELSLRRVTVADLSPLKGVPLKILNLDSCTLSDLSPLKGMQLKRLSLWSSSKITNLAPLAGMPLEWLNCANTKIHDLTPLKGTSLASFFCDSTYVKDLTPLQGLPLRVLRCDLKIVTRNAKVLQSITTLTTINNMPAAEFLKNPKDP